jgi:adaptin ear-binding coat-associated protein 1/2
MIISDVALQDYTKYVDVGFHSGFSPKRRIHSEFDVLLSPCRRQKALLNPVSSSDEPEPSPHIPAGPKRDYSLKEGQTFSISIPGGGKNPNRSSLLGSGSGAGSSNLLGGLGGSGGGGGGVPLLPPPPSVKRK